MKLKKSLALLVTLYLCVSLTGCGGFLDLIPDGSTEDSYILKTQVGKATIQDYRNGNELIYDLEYEQIRLGENDSARYPLLSSALEKFNSDSVSGMNEIKSEFIGMFDDLSSTTFSNFPLEYKSKFYVQRSDEHMISFVDYISSYTGGAHSNYGIQGHNFDTDTGEEMELSDIITDTSNLGEILETILTQKYPDISFFDLKNSLNGRNHEDFSWTVDYQGVTFWFSPYDLASFADGILSAKIWFNDYKDIFNSKYTYAPDDYALSIPPGVKIDLNSMDSNNNRECLKVAVLPDYQYSNQKLYITLGDNDEYIVGDEATFDFENYLVHRDGKNYLYADAYCNGESHTIMAFSLVDRQVKSIGELDNCTLPYTYVNNGNSGILYTDVFLNPINFELVSRMTVLGTRIGYGSYTVNKADGTLQRTSDAYTLESNTPVVTTSPIKGTAIKGNKEIEIPANSTLYPLRTDSKTYVELKTEDGNEIRLKCDTSGFPVTINGVPENECFKDLMYAG